MDDVTFENPMFDPDGPGVDDDFDPPMEPPFDVQPQLNASGDSLQSLQEEFREAELEAQKKRLDSFYNEVSDTYNGLRPENRIDYSQFGIDPDGKTLYWIPEDKKISITAMRGKFRFLGLETLARRYGDGGTYGVRRSLGLLDYRSGISRRLGREVVKTLPKNIGNLTEGSLRLADTIRQSAEDVETALKTINNPPMDTAWVTQARRELVGVWEAMMRSRDELANNLAKLSAIDDRKSEVEKHLAGERRKLTEPKFNKIFETEWRSLKASDIDRERQARLEALSTNRAALRSQINRIRETIRRLLHEDKTLAERIRTLFREQGITIASILTAIGTAISTLVLAVTGGGAGAPHRRLQSHPTRAGSRSGLKSTYRPLGVP